MLKTTLLAALVLLGSDKAAASFSWTQVDCGGLNEILQSSEPHKAGTRRLNYAQFVTLILQGRATVGWSPTRPMPSNLYVDPQVQSVEPISVPGTNAAYLIVIETKNHYPSTKVICTFTDMRGE